jgi:hypothetical protein
MGDFGFRVPKLFTLLNWHHVQEKTREVGQSGCLTQKVPGRVVASSMQNDASGVALHRRPTCRVKARFRARILSRTRTTVLLWAIPDSRQVSGISVVKFDQAAKPQGRQSVKNAVSSTFLAGKTTVFALWGGFSHPMPDGSGYLLSQTTPDSTSGSTGNTIAPWRGSHSPNWD